MVCTYSTSFLLCIYRVYLLAQGARRRDGRAGGRGRRDPRGPLGPLGVGLRLGWGVTKGSVRAETPCLYLAAPTPSKPYPIADSTVPLAVRSPHTLLSSMTAGPRNPLRRRRL